MKKKILILVLVVALVASMAVAFAGCNKDKDRFTFGLICLHDENSTYDKNFIDAAKAVAEELNVKLVIKTNIEESSACYDAAVDLVDQGADVIFADSFGHEDHMIRAAKEFADVQFAHATGTKAHTEELANYHNAFASIYEGRYLAGVAAGMKLLEMYPDATAYKMGYVGAFPYAEVVSGYTSFYLGAKSVMTAGKSITMEVQYTSSWYDPDKEGTAALALINNGAQLISQHADSMGAPNVCEEKGIPNVTYNISTKATCEDTYLIGSKINWAPYFKYLIEKTQKGEAVEKDWTGTLTNDAVQVLEFGAGVSDAIKNAVAEAKAEILSGERKVFDTATFTVTKTDSLNTAATVDATGKLTAYQADVHTDPNFQIIPDTQVVENGIFMESKFRSAPYFDVRIDGITEINN